MRIEDMILCCIEEPESRISWMLFQRIIVLVSLHHNFFCIFFPVYIRIKIFSPSFIKTVSSEWKRAFLCSILKCAENKLFFFITEYNNNKNLFRKNSKNHNEKKNRSHSVCLWQIEPKSTPTTWKPINPIHLQPHQNQLFTLIKSQNQNTGDL